MSEHTPGPWKISGLDPNVIGPVRILVMDGAEVPQQQAVARITERTGESTANAHLIAAAPDLLEALKAMLTLAPDPLGGVIDRSIRQRAKEAIAKAEGK